MSLEGGDSPQEGPIALVNRLEIVSVDGEITLREYAIEDAEEAFALIDRNRDFLSQNEEPTSINYPTLKSFQESILHPKNPKKKRFAIVNEEEVIVGSINLAPDETDARVGEIGYYLGEEFQKHGYAVRAIKTLTDYAFQNLGYIRLFGSVAPKNPRSIKALEKNGYLETARNHKGRIILTKGRMS
jgi:ribosomal-protein-serine acetyltransferase